MIYDLEVSFDGTAPPRMPPPPTWYVSGVLQPVCVANMQDIRQNADILLSDEALDSAREFFTARGGTLLWLVPIPCDPGMVERSAAVCLVCQPPAPAREHYICVDCTSRVANALDAGRVLR